MDMDVKEFLKETKFCDLGGTDIQIIAHKITEPSVSDAEKSEALFYWIKENIKFEFGYWGIKASGVLKRRVGMCTNKSNLLIALLRSVNIPAGYGILKVDTKEFYQELMCPIFRKMVSSTTTHIYVGIFLNEKWVRCDPSVDSELAKALKEKTPFATMTGFDITDEEIKNMKGILKRDEFIANIDENLNKPPRHAKGITLGILNSYLKFLREQKEAIRNLSDYQTENNFLEWLSKKNIDYFNFINNIKSGVV
jgi:transglutaminase-like putative cysteine protease